MMNTRCTVLEHKAILLIHGRSQKVRVEFNNYNILLWHLSKNNIQNLPAYCELQKSDFNNHVFLKSAYNQFKHITPLFASLVKNEC